MRHRQLELALQPGINGIPELIRDGMDGLLFTASDVAEMVEAIGRLIDNPEMRRSMAESSRARVADKYDLRKNVGRLAEVLGKWLAANL